MDSGISTTLTLPPRAAKRFSIKSRLGFGGMGEVFLARDEALDRDVAIKVIRPDLADDEDFVKRFKREVVTLSRISHPNVIHFYDVWDEESTLFYTMEYVEGKDLDHLIASGKLDVVKACELVAQVCDGLAAIHKAGVIHRDIKPGNVVVTSDGVPKLLDFSLATFVNPVTAHKITASGQLSGTLNYIAPEVFKGYDADEVSDVYQMGLLLYEALCCDHPFADLPILDIVQGIAANKVSSFIERIEGADEDLEDIVFRAMHVSIDDRIQSATALRDELNEWISSRGHSLIVSSRKVRVGIDVGGTFTHAVALSGAECKLVGSAKVPTTHSHEDGVAQGIVDALRQLIDGDGLDPRTISRVAHSTTQATNALLEGDVCKVGILAAGEGWDGKRASTQTEIGSLDLDEGSAIETVHRYVELSGDGNEESDREVIEKACRELSEEGVEALVAAAAFSVDNPQVEETILSVAAHCGLPATATHHISQLYGLRNRTRTATLNAAILPKMTETALKTKEAVRALGITAPVVVMRSDGGAMDVEQMQQRPILTILSGPAAGVAAALMAAHVSEGIFLEVGGTSTDISCIKDGRPHMQPARIGHHRLYVNTLDVRTVGIAGGSMVRLDGSNKVTAVGPRSAHIAGLRYAAFPSPANPIPDDAEAQRISPKEKDPKDYLGLAIPSLSPTWTITPTCAANLLRTVPEGDYALGDRGAARKAFEAVAKLVGSTALDVAQEVIDQGAATIEKAVTELLAEYGLDKSRARLVGGGGGAGVWLPVLGDRMDIPTGIVSSAPLISAIGAAMALLQETVERTLVDPSADDISRIREEAKLAVARSGAVHETIEVHVEVDRARGILRATAVGAHEFLTDNKTLPVEQLRTRAGELLQVESDEVDFIAQTERFTLFAADVTTKMLFGLFEKTESSWAVLDSRGRARLTAVDGGVRLIKKGRFVEDFEKAMEEYATFGDAGMSLPDTFLITDTRIVDLSGLMEIGQRLALCSEELANTAPDALVLLAVKRR